MSRYDQPSDDRSKRDAQALEAHLGAPGVMGFAKNYLEMQRQAQLHEQERTALESALNKQALKRKMYDERVDRMNLEMPALGTKYYLIGKQEKVDGLAERIKDGDLSAYLFTLNLCGNLGKDLPDDLMPDKKIIDDDLEAMSDMERLDWEEEQEKQWVQQNMSRESTASARQHFHMQDTEEYSDEDVGGVMHRAISRSQAETIKKAFKPFDDVLGDKQVDYLTHAIRSDINDPFVIGDTDLKSKWRSAMEGPDGILSQCFILDQKDPRIPMRVGGDENAVTFGSVFANT